jgi:hypothetical protein
MTNRFRITIIALSITALALAGFIFIRNLIDFPVYYEAGQSLINGRSDLYSSDFARGRLMDYRYPPFFLIAFYPLWLLPYSVSAFLWHIFSVLEIIACVFFLHRLSKPSPEVWMIALLSAAQYFVMALHYGNAHLLAVFLLFACFYFIAKKKDSLAALMIALSITIKLTPILMLPFFAIRRQWKFLALTVAFLLAANIAPAAYFGFDQNAQLLKAWRDKVLLDQEFHEINGPINLSLKGELRRYFTEIDYSRRLDGDTRYPAVNLASLSTGRSDLLWMILSLLAYLFVCALFWRRSRDDDNLSIEFGLMVCVMLMVGPLTSKIYFIALLWPIVSLSSVAFDEKSKLSRRILIFIAALNSILPLLPGRLTQRLLLALGADFFVNLLLMVALCWTLIRAKEPDDAPQRQARSVATDA